MARSPGVCSTGCSRNPWLRIETISGTSAGAMNAAVLADGWTKDAAAGARAALDSYWRLVARGAAFSPLQRSPLDRLLGRWSLDNSPGYLAFDLMTRVFSPYHLNPLGLNPLRTILAQSIDFDRLARSPIKLFITATSVRTGRGRIFRNAEISADVLLASACLPTMFQAIEIVRELSTTIAAATSHSTLCYPALLRSIPCVYRKPKPGRSDDEVRRGWRVI